MQGNVALYVKYSIGLESQYPYVIAILLVSTILWMPFWQFVIIKFGKKTAFSVGMWVFMPSTEIPTVQWMGPGGPITGGGDFTVSSTPPYTLSINPLRQYYDGQYTCQATIGNTTGSTSAALTVEGD